MTICSEMPLNHIPAILQIQHEDFWDNKIVDNTFAYTPELEQIVMSFENAEGTVPRFESFALASSGALYQRSSCYGDRPGKGIPFVRCQEQTCKVSS